MVCVCCVFLDRSARPLRDMQFLVVVNKQWTDYCRQMVWIIVPQGMLSDSVTFSDHDP